MQYVDVLGSRKRGLSRTNRGGEAYEISALTQLRRFLILGTEGGTYHVNQELLTELNVKAVAKMLETDPFIAIDEIVEISVSGRAPKNDPALLALAMAASFHDDSLGGEESLKIRTYALEQLPKVARTGTHLFTFVEFVNQLRGWGTGLRRAVGQWYLGKEPKALAYDVTKYQQRNGWSHRDVLRLSHPKVGDSEYQNIFRYVTHGEMNAPYKDDSEAMAYLNAVEAVKRATHEQEVVQLILEHKLPREVIPTPFLTSPFVWEALLFSGMPMHAMLRNLGNMGKAGILGSDSDGARSVIGQLHDKERIRRSRAHPIDILKAKFVYQSGQGWRGGNMWPVNTKIVGALENAFYLSFGNVEPTNKNIMLALDVSGSMTIGNVGGIVGFTPRIASAAMAMITARVEPYHLFTGFSHQMVPIDIRAEDHLDEVVRKIERIPMGGTDCRLPMVYARQHDLPVDAFVVYTDSETGYALPANELRRFRRHTGIIDAKLAVVGMLANQFTLADPSDPHMLDVVGFDSSTPAVLSEFIRGEV